MDYHNLSTAQAYCCIASKNSTFWACNRCDAKQKSRKHLSRTLLKRSLSISSLQISPRMMSNCYTHIPSIRTLESCSALRRNIFQPRESGYGTNIFLRSISSKVVLPFEEIFFPKRVPRAFVISINFGVWNDRFLLIMVPIDFVWFAFFSF